MTTSNKTLRVLALAFAIALAGCTEDIGSGRGDLGAGDACAIDSDCGAGLECELEHGGSFCKPHGGGADDGLGAPAGDACMIDADCEAGLECELEHGASFCQPHGGTASPAPTPAGTGAEGAFCATTADCAAGLECELEDEGMICRGSGRGR